MSWTCEPCSTINPANMMCAGCHGTEKALRCDHHVPSDAVTRPDVCKTCAVRERCTIGTDASPLRQAHAAARSAPADIIPPELHAAHHDAVELVGGGGPEHEATEACPKCHARVFSRLCGACGRIAPLTTAFKKYEGTAEGDHRPVVIEAVGPSGLAQKKIKRDDGKIDWTYLPFDALEEVVAVLKWAAEGPNAKYARESWRELKDDPEKGPPDLRSIKSALRHILADTNFHQRYDEETNLQHIAHAATQLLFAIAHRRRKEKKP